MGENVKKKPLSLNERHSRLLHDLSASQSKPPPSSTSHFMPSKENPPNFKLDFDSSPDMSNLSNEKQLESRQTLEDDDAIDNSIPSFSGINTPHDKMELEKEKVKPEKVKIQGRRRLCKVSSRNNDHLDDHQDVKHQFQDISDFSSPPQAKDLGSKVDGMGGNEIRDILNDLSSRLGFLSIEKKKNPRPVDVNSVPLNGDSLNAVGDKGVDGKKDDLGEFEFTSAGSSFTGSSGQSDSSYSVNGGSLQEKEAECESWSESDKDNLGGAEKPSKNMGCDDLRNASKNVNANPIVNPRKFVSNIKDDDDNDEDDCVVLGSKKLPRKEKSRDCVLNEDCDNSSVVQVLDDDDHNDNEIVSADEHAITLSDPKSTFKLPAKIGKMLYPHQRDGLKWLWSLHCQGKGGVLGDDMGLGKTMLISGYLAGLFNSRLVKRVMIVAPKTLVPHWIKELTATGLSQKIREYFGTSQKLRQYELQYVFQDKGILLTTYDIVRNNAKQLCGSGFYDDDCDDGPIWDYMILDEGHLIKNPSTQRAKSLLEIPCAHRIIISGTPIQNNLKELWALFNFCCPDLLGDKQWFKEKYEHPILRGNDKNASERDKRVGSMVAKELRERIQPYFLRRLKSEVFSQDGDTESAKLSKKNELIVWLRLTSCQRHLYEAFLNSEIVLSAFDGSPLAAITILKKICDHPYLLTKRAAEDLLEGMDSILNQEDRGLAEKLAMYAADLTDGDDLQEKHDNVSCKISFILSLLEKLIPKGHNVLIFSQTRKMLNLIQEALLTNGFEFLRIDGTTKASDRLKIVNEFQEGHGAPIFLLTSQVGGLGLTLTKADRVIVVDPAWNPSTDNQSVDRAYRIGQEKDVIVYRLMTCATIEEKIYRMQVFKGGLFKTATEHKEQTRYFTQQDLKELFSLPKDGFDISPTQLQLHAEHGHQISMSGYLETHIKFLESLGIGGVSHHSLLYSKSEPAPIAQVEEDMTRGKGTTNTTRRYYGSSSTERPIDCPQYAFNPKDVNLHKKNFASSPQSPPKMTESEIKERINRLSQLLSNKTTVSRLPDRGEKIRKQITDLRLELENVTTPKRSNEVIELDDIADELQRSLHV